MKHRTQHRTESEEARRNRLHAETRRENRELRRGLARAIRQVEKLQGLQALEEEVVSRDPKDVKDLRKAPLARGVGGPGGVRCPECRGPTTTVELPTGLLRCCRICPWRKKDGRDRTAT